MCNHDARRLRLGSLFDPVSEFRMDQGPADQLHQVGAAAVFEDGILEISLLSRILLDLLRVC